MAASTAQQDGHPADSGETPNLQADKRRGGRNDQKIVEIHLDGYSNLDYCNGKTEKSSRNGQIYYDETDLMAIRVGGWKMAIGVKPEGIWWEEKYYPSVPSIFNQLMDPVEKLDPLSHEWGYVGRKLVGRSSGGRRRLRCTCRRT